MDDLHSPLPAADAAEGLLDPAALHLGLLGVGHVPELTAAALGVLGAVGVLPVGGCLQDLVHPAPGGGLAHLQQLDGAELSLQGSLDKDGLPIQTGHALTGGAVALDPQGIFLILLGCHTEQLPSIVTGEHSSPPHTF